MPDMHSIDAELDRVAEQDTTMTYVLAIDQGTSGTKAIVVDEAGQVVVHRRGRAAPGLPARRRCRAGPRGAARLRGRCRSPSPGARPGVTVSAVALANQGETVLAWDRRTGRPLTPAIVWQDRRAESICAALAGSADTVRRADRAGPGSVFLGAEDGVDPGEPDP